MSKNVILYFVVQLTTVIALHATYNTENLSKAYGYARTRNEERLIQHVQQSIANAEQGISSLSKEALSLDGMSSTKVRHLLNNLCSLPETNYLEIGTWKGSTWIAALYNNSSNISSAIAIDNWSQFKGPKDQFVTNCNTFLKDTKYQLIEQDCFQIDLTLFSNPINLYFYDGDHTTLAQEKAFTYFNGIFDNIFIAVIDDWNFVGVPEGTYAAFAQLDYTILFETTLPARWVNDCDNWWNGIHIAVIRKTPSKQ